ncbi:hypothetical protein W97_00179 [Coniosporium apollinis CBS 100218]|uniref:Uncharacterized protein n=1 Tax=Coniosporium apollinis (strain CBS 100218) TaxID=1168221 RepID=R7YGN3_CONA1|nr:uncharacterized protein W97_00179 [Coniosporium apollinis CBS 100218]EON60969.1 hypothetical protein W97_00179 [Coniosporium apollinis CBS 100218]
MASSELAIRSTKHRAASRLTASQSSKRRHPGILAGIDEHNVIEVSDEDEAAPDNPTSSFHHHTTRASVYGRADALYDMKYHPMDDVMRPSQAAKRRKLTDVIEASSEEEDFVAQSSSSDYNGVDSRRRFGTQREPTSSRHSARTASKPLVNYDVRIHPQDNILADLGVPGFPRHWKRATVSAEDEVSTSRNKSKSCSSNSTARTSSSASNPSTKHKPSQGRKGTKDDRALQNSPHAIKRYAEPLGVWTLEPGERYFRHDVDSWFEDPSTRVDFTGDSEADFHILPMRRYRTNNPPGEVLDDEQAVLIHSSPHNEADSDAALLTLEDEEAGREYLVMEDQHVATYATSCSDGSGGSIEKDGREHSAEGNVTMPELVYEQSTKGDDLGAASTAQQPFTPGDSAGGDAIVVPSSRDTPTPESSLGSGSRNEQNEEQDDDQDEEQYDEQEPPVDGGDNHDDGPLTNAFILPLPTRYRSQRKSTSFNIHVDDEEAPRPSQSLLAPAATEDFDKENVDAQSESRSDSEPEDGHVAVRIDETSLAGDGTFHQSLDAETAEGQANDDMETGCQCCATNTLHVDQAPSDSSPSRDLHRSPDPITVQTIEHERDAIVQESDASQSSTQQSPPPASDSNNTATHTLSPPSTVPGTQRAAGTRFVEEVVEKARNIQDCGSAPSSDSYEHTAI